MQPAETNPVKLHEVVTDAQRVCEVVPLQHLICGGERILAKHNILQFAEWEAVQLVKHVLQAFKRVWPDDTLGRREQSLSGQICDCDKSSAGRHGEALPVQI